MTGDRCRSILQRPRTSLRLAAFNHFLSQAPLAQAELVKLAGHSVAWIIPPVRIVGTVTPHGTLAECESPPEAVLRVSLAGLVSKAQGKSLTPADIHLEGDTILACQLASATRHFAWHWGEDLSQLIGDVLAHRVERMANATMKACTTSALRLGENLAEYFTEEAFVLARGRDVNAFIRAVDVLRDDVARFDKKLSLLQHSLHREPTQASERTVIERGK